MKYICNMCGKEFELSKGQLKMYNTTGQSNFYCSEKCSKKSLKQRCKEHYYKHIEKNRKLINERARNYYNENKIKISSRSYSKELSPNQLGYENLTPQEKQIMLSKLLSAKTTAYSTNKYSKRRGVQLKVKHDKKTGKIYSWWCVEKQINGIIYRKRCDSEEEAIAYVEELENKYFSPDQLKIRNRSLKKNKK